MPDDGNTAEAWTLTLADRTLVMTKSGVNRLRFAALLVFCRIQGRFPKTPGELDDAVVASVAGQLEPGDYGEHDVASRTWKRDRAEIRAALGFREATVADAEVPDRDIALSDPIVASGEVFATAL
jgi:Domain of unknown function (DUF4158)